MNCGQIGAEYHISVSHRGNVCCLKETKFCNLSSGNSPHLPNGLNKQNTTHYKSLVGEKTPKTHPHPTTTVEFVFLHITHTPSCSQNTGSSLSLIRSLLNHRYLFVGIISGLHLNLPTWGCHKDQRFLLGWCMSPKKQRRKAQASILLAINVWEYGRHDNEWRGADNNDVWTGDQGRNESTMLFCRTIAAWSHAWWMLPIHLRTPFALGAFCASCFITANVWCLIFAHSALYHPPSWHKKSREAGRRRGEGRGGGSGRAMTWSEGWLGAGTLRETCFLFKLHLCLFPSASTALQRKAWAQPAMRLHGTLLRHTSGRSKWHNEGNGFLIHIFLEHTYSTWI